MGLPEGASAHSLVRPAGALVSYVSADATSLNTLRVREGDGRIEFYDPTVDGGMDPGSCTPGEVAGGFIIEVFCPASAVTRVRIDLGEREDSAKTSLPIATTLLGGPGADDLTAGIAADELSGGDGDDSLTGREGDDAMDGGLGVDTLEGGSGADQIQSRDGLVDTIRCGGDADIVYADTVDDIAADCETVNRVFVAPPSGSDGDEPGRPDLNVGTDKVQRLGSARRVRVYATSSEPGTISASGFIDIAGLSLPVKIDPSPIAIGGAGVELAYTLGKARWRRARRALRHGREVAVRLGVVATDVAGNTRRQDAPRIRVIPSRWSAAAGRAAAVRAPRHPTPGDMDGDEIKDVVDNCPTAKNGSQIDTDNDGQGDACDEDDDDDGVLDGGDNCRIDHNPDQADTDGDGYGDACPPVDSDQDGVINDDDNCDFDANPDQDDLDGDDKGDVCDRDLDGDRFDNDFDNCPTVYNLEPTDIDGDGLINDQVDRDGDGIGTACDPDEPVIEPPPDPDETPPDVTLEVPGNESLAQLEAGMIVRIGCSEACTATTDVVVNRRIANQLGLGHRRVLASGTTRLDGEGMTYAFVRAKARHLTGNGDLGSFHAKLKTRVTDESGNARELTRRFSLRR
jgi:hypothetical protein